MKEIWKDIKGYKGLYQVSNLGNVKSLNYNHTGKEKIIIPVIIRGYYRVTLCKNGVKQFFVHRLVYEAFYGKIPFWMQVNHINERKDENNIYNLNVLTPKQNINWGTRIERFSAKMINGKNSKQVLQLDKQNNIINKWPSTMEIERQLGYHNSKISECCLGKRKTAYGFIWRYSSDSQPIPQ